MRPMVRLLGGLGKAGGLYLDLGHTASINTGENWHNNPLRLNQSNIADGGRRTAICRAR